MLSAEAIAMHHLLSWMWTVLFYLWIASELVIAFATRTGREKGSVRDRGTQLLLWLSIVPAVTACEFLRYVSRGQITSGSEWLPALTVAVLVLGLVIRCTAIAMLGKAFSANVAILDSQRLNTSGLYRWVRHPSYLGLALVFLSIALHSRHWIGLAIMAIPTAVLLYRIHVEELALRDAFGADYIAYSQKTKRLVPGIY
jgi:protein-S-isoprenylcysteine O-methyltransferase Ste14